MYFVYINLEERKEKNQHMHNMLESLNVKFSRFDAIKPTLDQVGKINKLSDKLNNFFECSKQIPRGIGVVGCYLSHIQVLFDYKDIDSEYLCILEDDVQFDSNTLKYVKNTIDFLKNNKKEWDILRSIWDRIPLEFKGLDKINMEKNVLYKFNSPNYLSIYNREGDNNGISGGCHFYIINKKNIKKIINFIDCEEVYNIDSVYSTNMLNVYAILNKDANIDIPMKYRKQTNIPKV
tara:strand:- start:674 stop:1378 length:705 start_codon:yes stop_codon:yes gene_type:complete